MFPSVSLDLHNGTDFFAGVFRILGEDIVVDILQNDLPAALALSHPVLSDSAFFSGGRGT